MLRELYVELKTVTGAVARKIVEQYSHEHIYAFNLYTHPLLSYLCDNFSTETGLTAVATEYLTKTTYFRNGETLDQARHELRWGPPDSPHHCLFVDQFTRVDVILDEIWEDYNSLSSEALRRRLKDVEDTCIDVLVEIRNARIFERDVMLNIVCGDQSFEERVVTGELINYPCVMDRYCSEVTLDQQIIARLRRARQER